MGRYNPSVYRGAVLLILAFLLLLSACARSRGGSATAYDGFVVRTERAREADASEPTPPLERALPGGSETEEDYILNKSSGKFHYPSCSAVKDIKEALDRAFRSKKHDTPEMKEIRKEIDALQRQLEAAEAELRKKFEELPQFRDQVATVSTNAVHLRALARERERLYRERERISADNEAKK